MKLVKPAALHMENVSVIQCSPKNVGNWVSKSGRIKLSSCLIDFESNTVSLGVKIARLQFGSDVYHGVIPLIHKTNSTIVECLVDHIEQK
jgi:hypothetical protein